MVEELYKTYAPALLRYCVSLAGDVGTAEDLCQETFLRAMTHQEDWRGLERIQRRAWLYTTAKRLFIDRVRKLSREVELQGEELLRMVKEEDYTQAAVNELIDRLPDSERGLFVMRYFQGYDSTELGELYDLPPATVRSRLASARKRLTEWLGLRDERGEKDENTTLNEGGI